MSEAPPSSFLARNEFLIRRLHSLSGMIPVGAYMVVHLLTNATVLDSPASFQKNVYSIHSLGIILPLVEWVFIFIPILFHAIVGVLIVRGSLPNNSTYKYTSNFRYTLQRATGMIAFAFIMWHVFHMHGWFHADAWLNTISGLGGGMFRPYNAASSGAEAMRVSMPIVTILYAIGVLSCVFHLANGIWTFGIGLGIVGMSALAGFAFVVDPAKAKLAEDKMYDSKTASGELAPNEHKRTHAIEHAAAPPAN